MATLAPSAFPSTTRTRPELESKKTISPQDYARLVESHSKRSAAETVYPGTNFANLAAYLLGPYERHNAASSHENVSANEPMVDTSYVTLYCFGDRGNNSTHHFSLSTQLTNLNLEAQTDIKGRLLFIRGNVAPEWLAVIGAKFLLDPEFFQRHLDFKHVIRRPDYFLLPTMPSGASQMTRFRLNTIGYVMQHHRTGRGLDQADLDMVRHRAEDSWADYVERLARGREGESRSGDSIVREFSIHDHDHFSLEQDVSVHITSADDKWLVVVWLDVGQALNLGPAEPWSPKLFGVDPLEISLHPTIQQRDGVALDGKSYINETVKSEEDDTNHCRIVQTASLLHLEYDRHLEADTVSDLPIFVLIDILRLCANSEVQLLNMIEAKISTELSPARSQAQNEPTVSNLLYHKRVLRRHMQRLLENKSFIETQASMTQHDSLKPCLPSGSKSKLDTILHDFDYLLEKAKDLANECDRGMGIMMNKASIKEAQKAIVQAERITKLTKLAFVFVPLSFTCSFFGMNFSQFSEDSDLSLWIWATLSAPILILSMIFMNWDVAWEIRRWLTWADRASQPFRTWLTERSSRLYAHSIDRRKLTPEV
ncbi:hypothetical protein Z517_12421 [Fonsecaea pedrosoi CBS 271.37]|uniref:Uncharacterized protein n=1 Tax=Fonsecaea pedrosoi CBS 271.37 TaxID=1442368 RepID=A0A0D2DA81_9EURO|nr:uncharacterized protein Z517_12421 [Fonsecaea pedrosoi CBS 271.37]KIW74481.1 hypothetical protein Z517_12421 [Fonsecaea pedrosoi CBS 271.37]